MVGYAEQLKKLLYIDKYGYSMTYVSVRSISTFLKCHPFGHASSTETWETMDVPKRLDERILVDTRTAQLPRPVTTGADQLSRNLNELGAQRLHPIWLHSLRQTEATKPIVEVVR